MKLNSEYKQITDDIINKEIFQKLSEDTHHGSNKYEHSKRVSYLSFLLTKLFKGDYKRATRAGLLHDFFFGTRFEKKENDLLNHPNTSVINAQKFFNVDDIEADIIRNHMYHYAFLKRISFLSNKEDKNYFQNNKPKNKEEIIVCLADLLVSIYEGLRFKVNYSISLYLLFIINSFLV